MARRRGPGRPKNKVPSLIVRVTLPSPLKRAAVAHARRQGLGLGTWFRQLAIQALDQRGAA